MRRNIERAARLVRGVLAPQDTHNQEDNLPAVFGKRLSRRKFLQGTTAALAAAAMGTEIRNVLAQSPDLNSPSHDKWVAVDSPSKAPPPPEGDAEGEESGAETLFQTMTWRLEQGVEQLSPELQARIDANPNWSFQVANWDVVMDYSKAPLFLEAAKQYGVTRFGFYRGPETADIWETYVNGVVRDLLRDNPQVVYLNLDVTDPDQRESIVTFDADNLPPMVVELHDKANFTQDIEGLGGTAGKVTDSTNAPAVTMAVIDHGQFVVRLYMPKEIVGSIETGTGATLALLGRMSNTTSGDIQKKYQFYQNTMRSTENGGYFAPVGMSDAEAALLGIDF